MSVYVDDLKVVGSIRAGFCGWRVVRISRIAASVTTSIPRPRIAGERLRKG